MTWEDGFFWMVTGSYRRYLALRDERRRTTAQMWQRYQEERARLMAYVDRYRAGNRATQAKSRLHAIARLDAAAVAPAARARTDPARLAHRGAEMSGTHALVVDDLVLRRGDRAWAPLSFKVPAAGRVGIVGPNGSGKTTLLRALVTSEPGVRWNPDAVVSWYDQEAAALLPADETGLRLANDEGMDKETAFHLGARFGLKPDLLETRTGTWSGGERSRLALLFALMARSTALVLDEPTNHLDLPMREELERLLVGYPGAVLLVSHDRELVDNIATHMLWWDGDQFLFRPGRYSEVAARL
jgi:ATP-binding cassette subfamily F protein 3